MNCHYFIAISYLSLIITNAIATAQETSKAKSQTTVIDYRSINPTFPSEKVFLHTDRSDYTAGDTLWFKAYSWYGYDQVPDTMSRVLYVDLVGKDNNTLVHKKLFVQGGISMGEMGISKNIAPGVYHLRAYTQWMQNPNTGDPFYKTITIKPEIKDIEVQLNPIVIKQPGNDSLRVNLLFSESDETGNIINNEKHNMRYELIVGKDSLQKGRMQIINNKVSTFTYSLAGIHKTDSVVVFNVSSNDSSLTFAKQYQIPLIERLDVQFFPEGGNLVNGVESRIAFKAIGSDGLSREVKGTVKDNKGAVITGFKSVHKGMGAFLLKPEADQTYFAMVEYRNMQYKFPLPPALKDGFTLSVNFSDGRFNPSLTIKHRQPGSPVKKYIAGSMNGKIRFAYAIEITKDSVRLQIPVNLLNEGICRLTVMDSAFNPECERLFYVNKRERFNIEVISDSSSYKTRSKVTLTLKTTRADGSPLPANLSLAVVDQGQTNQNKDAGGICAYKLLGSELKGTIEDPDWYFTNDSCTRSNALDLVLLTHGYRRFLKGGKTNDTLKFQPERDVLVSGKIELPGNKKYKKSRDYRNMNLSLVLFGGSSFATQLVSDSLGKFTFHIPLFFGITNGFLSAKTQRNKPFKGDIIVDEEVNNPSFTPGTDLHNNPGYSAADYLNPMPPVQKLEKPKINKGEPKLIELKEVIVKRRDKFWFKRFDKEALKIVNLDSLDPTGKKYESLNDVLIREFKARGELVNSNGYHFTTVKLPCISPGPEYWYPIYVLNETTFLNEGERDAEFILSRLNLLNLMHVNEIKKLKVLPPKAQIPSFYADPGVLSWPMQQSMIVIETYKKGYRGNPDGGKAMILEGLKSPRAFYAPRYEGPVKDNPVNDHRVTLYWEPSVNTTKDGITKVDFYTSDRKTNMEVIVNGMETGSGNTGQGQILIKIP